MVSLSYISGSVPTTRSSNFHTLFLLMRVCAELELPSWDKRCLVTSQDFNFFLPNFTWLFGFEIVAKQHKQLRVALNFRFVRLHLPRARITGTVHHAWFTQHWTGTQGFVHARLYQLSYIPALSFNWKRVVIQNLVEPRVATD